MRHILLQFILAIDILKSALPSPQPNLKCLLTKHELNLYGGRWPVVLSFICRALVLTVNCI